MGSLRLGDEFTWDGRRLKITHFHDEPNSGLCRVSYNRFEFTMPVSFVEALRELERLRTENARFAESALRDSALFIDVFRMLEKCLDWFGHKEIDGMRDECARALYGDHSKSDAVADHASREDELNRLRTENARLREALEPMARDELRAGYLSTYMGGYRSPATIEAFRHGMETVFNGLVERASRALATPGTGTEDGNG